MYKTHNYDTKKALERGIEVKKKKIRRCKFVCFFWGGGEACSHLSCVRQPSQDGNSIRRNRSTFGGCSQRTRGALTSTRILIERMQRRPERSPQMQRELKFSRGSRMANPSDSWHVDSDDTVQHGRRVLVVLTTPSPHPLLQQKPIALCFECLVATSPYPIPWVYNCSPSTTYPKLPLAISFSPNCLLPTDTHPTDKCRFQSVELILFFFKFSVLFFFCVLTHLFFLTLHLIPTAAPRSGLTLGMACSEHCGVLRTAWSNVDEAWEAQLWVHAPELFSDV